MNRLAIQLLIAVLLLVLGFATGWHAKGVSVAAGQTKAEHAETQAVIAGVDKQATAQHADQVAEQGKSVALGINQASIRATGDRLQAEIDRASFSVTPPAVVLGSPAVSIRCPADPVGSDDFVRLYNAAARGADPAVAASTSPR